MQGKGGVALSFIDELDLLDIQGDQMEEENGVTGSILNELDSYDIQRDQIGR